MEIFRNGLSARWSKYALTAALIPAGVLLFGCKAKPPAMGPSGPPEVAFVTVSPERAVLTTELPGRISAYLVAEIRPQVNGLIQTRQFQEGANVNAGQLLYQIDPAPFKAALDQAQASLVTSQADLVTAEANLPALRAREQRLKGLVAIHAVAQQDYDDASAALRQAEANLAARKAAVEVNRAAVESAKVSLSYTPVKAPISGRIGKSNVTVGGMATAYQSSLAMIQQIDPIYVDVAQSSAELLRLRQRLEAGHLKRSGSGQNKVKLILEDKSVYPIEGTLQFRDVTVDPATGSFTLRIVLRNPDHVLLPGMFVRAVVQEGVAEEALLVPQQGVTRDTKGIPVALVVNQSGVIEQRVLELDRAIGDRWLVTKGLATGDKLVVEGMQHVRPGTPVRAVPFKEQPAGGPRAQADRGKNV